MKQLQHWKSVSTQQEEALGYIREGNKGLIDKEKGPYVLVAVSQPNLFHPYTK